MARGSNWATPIFPHVQDIAPGRVGVVIRPETARLIKTGLTAGVVSVSFLGPVAEVTFQTDVGLITANLPDSAICGLHPGARVALDVVPGSLHLLPPETA